MKSVRRIARLLEAAKRDAKSNEREYFRTRSGQTILCESAGEYDWWQNFDSALTSGELKPEDFSIRDIFESFIPDGRSLADAWKRGDSISLQEAAGTVSASQFTNITGQIIYSKIMDSYQSEEFVFTNLIPTIATQFNGEKIPGIAQMGDQAEVVNEGEAYPRAGFNEDWIETPQTSKRGTVVEVTKEAIFFDRTGLILKRAGEVGYFLGVNKEKRAIRCVIDQNTTAHRYRWKGSSYATYQSSTPWINSKTSNSLTDWSKVDAVEQLFANMVDPYTGEPIVVNADTLIVTPQLQQTAAYIMNATMVGVKQGGFATSGTLYHMDVPNPVGAAGSPFTNRYRLVTSRLLAAELATDTDWFLGRPSEAFAYMENFPMTVTTAPAGNDDEFNRDIVSKTKASERGAFATLEPRKMAKSAA